jgi:hypothetical protein
MESGVPPQREELHTSPNICVSAEVFTPCKHADRIIMAHKTMPTAIPFSFLKSDFMASPKARWLRLLNASPA